MLVRIQTSRISALISTLIYGPFNFISPHYYAIIGKPSFKIIRVKTNKETAKTKHINNNNNKNKTNSSISHITETTIIVLQNTAHATTQVGHTKTKTKLSKTADQS